MQLFVEEAKELKEADFFSSSDSYCKITGQYGFGFVFLSILSRCGFGDTNTNQKERLVFVRSDIIWSNSGQLRRLNKKTIN